MSDRLLFNVEEVALALTVSTKTVERAAKKPDFPKPVKANPKRWHINDIINWKVAKENKPLVAELEKVKKKPVTKAIDLKRVSDNELKRYEALERTIEMADGITLINAIKLMGEINEKVAAVHVEEVNLKFGEIEQIDRNGKSVIVATGEEL